MVTAPFANAAWWTASVPSWMAFDTALSDPGRAQEQILRQLLKRNADTAFGKEHGFAHIHSHEQFARQIPARDYNDFEPWIDRIRQGESRVLTAEPVTRLIPTSGSTAARKLIPYTASMQRELNRAIGPWIVDLYRQFPSVMLGPAYWSVTPVAEQLTDKFDDSKVPIGFDDDSDYLGGWRRHAVNAVMAVPPAVCAIDSIDVWRYVTLLLLLRRADLALISVWHPSFLDLLLKSLAADWNRLIEDVANGTCAVERHLSASIAGIAQARPLPNRARGLKSAGPANASRVWPSLRVVSCWADANAAPPAGVLARSFPGVSIQAKGLLATEGVVSIPYRGKHPLAIRSHFLEFEDDAGSIRLAPDLETGETYSVLLTNGVGLCRYRLHDRVCVDARVQNTPSIRFAGKAGLVSDRFGEKLTDSFVTGVLSQLLAPGSNRPSFAMLAPDVDRHGCRYTLYVDADLRSDHIKLLDVLLSQNPQYAYCRRLGQLLAPRIFRLTADPYACYVERLQHEGQRLGDIKPVAISPADGWSGVFKGVYVSGEATDGR